MIGVGDVELQAKPLTFSERGFPYSEFPVGWFQVGWSGQLAVGAVVPLHFFDTDLVLFRTDGGAAAVLDATCPHMGAHLGFGGEVTGDCLRCPYHGWEWDAGGDLVDVPYSRRTPEVSTRAWPTEESAGIIYVWHDQRGGPPTWSPPSITEDDDPTFHRPYPHGTTAERVMTHPQFVVENFPDIVHMKYVHEWLEVPVPDIYDLSGPIAHNAYRGLIATPKGSVEVYNHGYAYGIGINVARITGPMSSCTVGAFTPIDQTWSMGFASVWVQKRRDDEEQPTGVGAAMIRANLAQLLGDDHDRPIFEHLRYQTKPMLVPEEAALHRDFRRWSKQFYPESAQ